MYTIFRISYEFQFLRAIHDFQPEEVFCLTGRKIAKCDIGKRFEYRCSYVLTNMSLREFLKKQGVEHQKTEMDYRKQRFPWTEVTQEELNYCIADVLGLYEALKKMMKADHMALSELPMTSTGYVRQDFKSAMRKGGFIPWARSCAPDFEVYLMIRRAFRGGNTHCSRLYTGVIMDNVTSYDRSSSYPDTLVNFPYPVTPWVKQDIHQLSELLDGFPYLIEVELWNVDLRDPFNGCPYLAVHKCYDLDYANTISDNGRLCKTPYMRVYLTEIDLGITMAQYKWDRENVVRCYRSEYGMLPAPAIETIMHYYKLKTELKNVEGRENDYNRAKARLNSCYGMAATNPLRTSMVFNGVDFTPKEYDEEEELRKANGKSFMPYVVGCYCTAYARKMLQDAIDLCGYKFIYCDTDSVKFAGDVDFSSLNSVIQARSEKHHAYADDPFGVRHYLGVWEREGKDLTKPTYKRFVSLGAKKYAYEDEKGLHITLAGVSKSGVKELNGKLENFREGWVFRESAGLEAAYNDLGHDPVVIDGHTVEIPPNIWLHQSTYVLGLTLDYKDLFKLTQENFDKIMKSR